MEGLDPPWDKRSSFPPAPGRFFFRPARGGAPGARAWSARARTSGEARAVARGRPCAGEAPAVNTLRALVQALDLAALEAAFRQHARELSEAAPTPGPCVIALDGKTLKRSFDHLSDKAAAHPRRCRPHRR
jgi:hypothetical protein